MQTITKVRILIGWGILTLLALLLLFTPQYAKVVKADELWVKNEGGLAILVDGHVTDVQLSGATNIKDGIGDGEYSALYGWNPDYNGQTMVVAASVTSGWIVITGDISGYTVVSSEDQYGKDVAPEVRWVKDAPASHDYTSDNQGSSDALVPTYDFPDPYWLWT